MRALKLPAAHTLYERRQLDLCLGRAAPVTPHHGATGSSCGKRAIRCTAASGPRTHALSAPSYVRSHGVDPPFVATGTSMCVAERAAGRGLTAHAMGIACRTHHRRRHHCLRLHPHHLHLLATPPPTCPSPPPLSPIACLLHPSLASAAHTLRYRSPLSPVARALRYHPLLSHAAIARCNRPPLSLATIARYFRHRRSDRRSH